MGKIRVADLALQMGSVSIEFLFLLQAGGVDVKSPQAALDESTVMAILQGKTHAPKQLIVRDTEARAPRPQKSALSRIKIIEKPPGKSDEVEAEAAPAPRREKAPRAAVPAEPASTAVIPEEEPETREAPAAAAPAPPPAPTAPSAPPAAPSAGAASASTGAGAPSAPAAAGIAGPPASA